MRRFERSSVEDLGHVNPVKSAVTGARQRLPIDSAGNLVVGQTIGLLTQGGLSWGPWAITLDPMSLTNGYQSSPYPPGAGFGRTGEPRCIVKFGVGGLTRVVEFDYPFAGGCLVVNTDRVEVAVRAMTGGAVDPTSPPSVGAWLTPASQQSVEVPLALTFLTGTAFIPAFAKYLVTAPWQAFGVALPAGDVFVSFTAFGGSAQWNYQFSYPAGGPSQPFRVPIPPLATTVSINYSTAPDSTQFFELSLA